MIYNCSNDIVLDKPRQILHGPYLDEDTKLTKEICTFYRMDKSFELEAKELGDCFTIVETKGKKIAGCLSFVPFIHNGDVLFVYIFL